MKTKEIIDILIIIMILAAFFLMWAKQEYNNPLVTLLWAIIVINQIFKLLK